MLEPLHIAQLLRLQKTAGEHVDTIIKGKLGLFNTLLTPSTWKAVLEYYSCKPDKVQDFLIPKNTSPALEMVVDPVAASIDAVIGQLHWTNPEMEEVSRILLRDWRRRLALLLSESKAMAPL
jgi:hypothetical protein